MTRELFNAVISAYATAERKGPVCNVYKDPELRRAYERAHRRIDEAEVTGPHYALLPLITCDGGRIWLQPYWTVGDLAFANQNAASRCFRETVEREVRGLFRDEHAKWEKVYHALPNEDAKREALVKRLKAQGYPPDQIDDIVTGFFWKRD